MTLPARNVDADGTEYRVIRAYDTGRSLGSGHPDRGYVAASLGSRLTVRGDIYLVPECRVAERHGETWVS